VGKTEMQTALLVGKWDIFDQYLATSRKRDKIQHVLAY